MGGPSPSTTVVEGGLAKAASALSSADNNGPASCCASARAPARPTVSAKCSLPAVTQGIFRHACRCANAARQVVRSIRHAQQFALRLDDLADQGLVAGSDVHLGGRKRFWRNADDLYLIRHQPKDAQRFRLDCRPKWPASADCRRRDRYPRAARKVHAARCEMPAGLEPAALAATDRRHCRNNPRKAHRK